MALTYTPRGELGSTCPDFSLPSVDGKKVSLADFATSAQVLVVMFICSHCPYVKAIEDRLIALAAEFAGRPVAFVGICSNDSYDYPEDAPAALLARWREKGYGFPYLIDESQEVARAFGAVCTPDFFVYDRNRKLAYRGRLDDSWRAPERVQRRELRDAVVALLEAGGTAPGKGLTEQNPSMGCSIKWKSQG